MTTTPTIGAADMPEALINIAREIEALKRDCGMDTESAIAIQNGRYMAISSKIRALAAGQATAAQPGVVYAELPDEGEPWRGHKFKEVQRGCWRCDCGKTIKEVTSDQSTPASGGNYPVMPKRYTVDDDGEELFTAEKMRAFADATHTLRASHGQAPADAKALAEADRRAGEAERILATCKENVMRFEQVRSRMKYQWGAEQRVSFDEVWDEALALKKAAQAAPQAADSVLEDAARLDWLEQNLFHREKDEWDTKFGGYKEYNMWVLFSPKGIQGSARNIIDAAREQGADHDR